MGILGQGDSGPPPAPGRDDTGLLALWRFDEGSGSVADADGLAGDVSTQLVLSGDVTWGSGSLVFGPARTGIAQAITTNNAVLQSIVAAGEFWVELWITPSGTVSQTGPARIFGSSDAAAANTVRNFMLGGGGTSSDHKFQGRIAVGGTDNNGQLSGFVDPLISTGTEFQDTLTQVVMTYASGGLCYIYIDGNPVPIDSNIITPGTVFQGGEWSTSFPLVLGNEQQDPPAGGLPDGTRGFEGQVHFLAIGNTAYTTAQLATNFTAGPDGTGVPQPPTVRFDVTSGSSAESPSQSYIQNVGISVSPIQALDVYFTVTPGTANVASFLGDPSVPNPDVTVLSAESPQGQAGTHTITTSAAGSGIVELQIETDTEPVESAETLTLTIEPPNLAAGANGYQVHPTNFTHTRTILAQGQPPPPAGDRPGASNTGPEGTGVYWPVGQYGTGAGITHTPVTKAQVSFVSNSGTFTTSAPGETVQFLQGGTIRIEHDDCHVRRCDVGQVKVVTGLNCLIEDCWLDGGFDATTGLGIQQPIRVENPTTLSAGCEVRYCDIQGSSAAGMAADGGGKADNIHYWHHNNIHHNSSDAILCNRNCEISHNWSHHNGMAAHSHCDFFQVRSGGENIWLHHNFAYQPHPNNPGSSSPGVDPLGIPRSAQDAGADSALGSIVGGFYPHAIDGVPTGRTVNVPGGHPNNGLLAGAGRWTQPLESRGVNPPPTGGQTGPIAHLGSSDGPYDTLAAQAGAVNVTPFFPTATQFTNTGSGPFTIGGKWTFKSNSAVLISSSANGNVNGGPNKFRIENNWMNGGSTIVNIIKKNGTLSDGSGPILAPQNVEVRDNIFGDLWSSQPYSQVAGTNTVVVGNTWATEDLVDMYATEWDAPGTGYPEGETIMGGFTTITEHATGGFPPGPAFGMRCWFSQ